MNNDLVKQILDEINLGVISQYNDFFANEIIKDYDDSFFPAYGRVCMYIDSGKKYESYFENITTTLQSFIKFAKKTSKYDVVLSFSQMIEYINRSRKCFDKIFNILGIDYDIPHFQTKELVKTVERKLNDTTIERSVVLANLLLDLSNKALKYVKDNSFYGDVYRIKSMSVKMTKKTQDQKIEEAIVEVNKVLAKKYVPDFFGNGEEEFKEMMPTLFKSLSVLCLLEKDIISEIYKDYPDFKENKLKQFVVSELKQYYSFVGEKINEQTFSNYSDSELKEILEKIKKINIVKTIGLETGIKGSGKGEQYLNSLIGLESVKESINKIKAYTKANKSSKNLNMHMCFYGNPGTGKTEVARVIAQILFENKILPTNNVVETDRSGLVGEYLGETPLKTQAVINRAMGGVLFIDEAYSLAKKDAGYDYGHEAVATLIKAMEDNRGKFVVILAGYKNLLTDMLKTNPGFNSRIQFHIDFPNYSRDELGEILDLMISKKYTITDDAKNKILDVTDVKKKDVNFANAREIRNILDQVIMCLNLRDSKSKEITVEDVNKYIKDNKLSLPTNGSSNKILSGDEELENLIGLDSIKKTIKKIKAYAKKNVDSNLNIHMCFYGNPGTGKTEVARILSRVLHDAGALSEAKVIETNPNGLIGKYVGETGPKTEAIVNDALGGILFIDEAYGLCNGNGVSSNYGAEAIATLLKEMEDKRGQFCCVLAGYKNEMKMMLQTNPGFESRIQFELDFLDYSKEEIIQIARLMLKKQNYEITSEAMDKVSQIVENERNKPTFANARTLRNILDKVILNQTFRTEDDTNNNTITIEDVNEYINENNIVLEKEASNQFIDVLKLQKLYSDFSEEIDDDYLDQSVISISGKSGEGTGFIISPDGLCLTCNHCIVDDGSSQQARVIFKFGSKKIKIYSKFIVINKDEKNDIALIKLTDEENVYNFIPLNDGSYQYKSLNEFIMAGYPFGGESFSSISITDGKIASVNDYNGRKVVFANMFGKPGNSGSPVLDKENKTLIGLFWGGISKGNEMIPCFTPIDVIWTIFNSK